MSEPSILRIAAIADLHYGKSSGGKLATALDQANEAADVLLLCGDLTDYGLPEEAELLGRDLREHVDVPVLAVLGNHDFESARQDEVVDCLAAAGVHVLDGTCTEIGGVGFAGVRGYGGGFGRWALSPWGEPMTKAFVQEAVDQELKLDAALSRLESPHRVVLLHYAPIRDTVVGEPEEIMPFLGSGRLAEPINRHEVTAVFHGHAHHGAPEGQTATGVPVYNVSAPLLARCYPDRPPFRLLEVHVAGEEPVATGN
jgi:Icc-related predicted phosphoesterase